MTRAQVCRTAFTFFVPLAVLGCGTTSPPGENNNANQNQNSANDNGDGTAVALTVRPMLQRRASAGRVVGFVNKGQVSRADAESTITPWDFNVSSLQTGASQFRGTFDVGTTITLVADELYFPGTSSGATDPNAPSVPAQFVSWEGDTLTDSADPASDKGVLSFTLNEDREIDAIFDESYLLTIRVSGGPSGTLLNYDVRSTPLIIPFVQPGNARNINIVGVSPEDPDQPMRLWGYFNNSTVITFTVPEPWPFTSWQGLGNLQGRTIEVTMAQPSNLLLTFP
jgi:hypothetical protein